MKVNQAHEFDENIKLTLQNTSNNPQEVFYYKVPKYVHLTNCKYDVKNNSYEQLTSNSIIGKFSQSGLLLEPFLLLKKLLLASFG